ncbi:MAG TPA: YitT family protein [Alphaproteobacteria bacterium]
MQDTEYWTTRVKETLYITAGILSACLGLKGFLLPNHFLDGGVNGIALLLRATTGLPLPFLIMVINIPFIAIGMKTISKYFALRTMLAIIGLALCLIFLPMPHVTKDAFLVALFGGFFLGLGIGLAIHGNAVIDGTEVLAIYLSRITPMTVGGVIFGINVIIFSVAAYVEGVETAMYAMITYLTAARTVEFVLNGVEEYTAITIVSEKPAKVQKVLTQILGYGVTIYNGLSGYGGSGEWEGDKRVILQTIVTRLEVKRVINAVLRIDADAFMFETRIADAFGGKINKKQHIGKAVKSHSVSSKTKS